MLAAQGSPGAASAIASRAMAELCAIYWRPLYHYVRRCGHTHHEAEDFTQEFFARLLAKNVVADADPAKGRFRSFLLASLKHFLANQWDRAHAQKRGGDRVVISLDGLTEEARNALEPADGLTPEQAFDREWAHTVLQQTLAQLRAEFAAAGREKWFDALKDCLTGEAGPEKQSELAARLGLSTGALKVAIHRLRRRYREMLRAEIAQTVTAPAMVEDEIRRLFAVFS
ncbi:MAG: sigma-70 family RNA polymerase sigma factor [Verrucomicrobia bacterium]|nr:sigma-70 family RNA polymerase sigma factor [Verrucomicrobiota bacterium]MBU4248594.1 sigma-70 family RNA polymerase sigma factor [Verrucomicrobiota bacterium]MBU4290534.1 sigma-70 family RNA polymerase sigma factor [Verrucomicrobiota bacterium]MBU4429147.1 sigma-70 family RNA polymerase sigma factor [Verrucomicrobiota bacterium]